MKISHKQNNIFDYTPQIIDESQLLPFFKKLLRKGWRKLPGDHGYILTHLLRIRGERGGWDHPNNMIFVDEGSSQENLNQAYNFALLALESCPSKTIKAFIFQDTWIDTIDTHDTWIDTNEWKLTFTEEVEIDLESYDAHQLLILQKIDEC